MPNYLPNINDRIVLPDSHNTGCKGTLTKWYLHPVFASVDKNTLSKGTLYITKAIVDAVDGIFEGIDFEDVFCYFDPNKATAEKLGRDTVQFVNCRFYGWEGDVDKNGTVEHQWARYAIDNRDKNLNISCDYCTFLNFGSSANNDLGAYTLNHCFTDKMQGDHFKSGDNIYILNSYSRVGGLAPGAHADGVQFSQGSDLHIDNYRCELIGIKGVNVANSAIYVDFETGDNKVLSRGTIKNVTAIGGEFTFRIGAADGYTIENVDVSNYRYGCSSHYGPYRTLDYDYGFEENSKAVDTVMISSVWKENDMIKFLATNYTNEARTITVTTNHGTEQFTIPKCPTWNEYYDTYTNVNQFPFDIPFEVEDADYIVIHDSGRQVRYMSFTSKYENVGEWLKDTCDAIREKKGSSAMIDHENIPEEIRSIQSGGGTEGSTIRIENGRLIVTNATLRDGSLIL